MAAKTSPYQPSFKVSLKKKKLLTPHAKSIKESMCCFKSDSLSNTVIPQTSKKLNQILAEYPNDIKSWCPSGKPRNEKKKHSRTVLNGFTAFRSYYSKFVKDYSQQIQLSRKLTKIWKEDTSIHDYWDKIAISYRHDFSNFSFTEWMFHKEQEKLKSIEKPHKPPAIIPSILVEDIYMNDIEK